MFKNKFKVILFAIFIMLPVTLFASSGSGVETDLVHRMAMLVLQLSMIIFAAWLGGFLFTKINLPPVLGEIISGIIIGPYLLGGVSLPGFVNGIFPISLSSSLPVSVELYSFATIASIILLFLVGLETDIKTFFRFSFAGSIIGTVGVVVSFICGDIVGIIISPYIFGVQYGFSHPIPLFLGVISTATSVGITARILSDKKKMDSPEGVTVLSAAVIDDVIGIIMLAIIVGIARSGHVEWKQVTIVGVKAISVWIGFTILGLIFAPKISKVLKELKDKGTISIMSLALALFLAGIFEKSGLAMIIGAYIMGLSLSKTDLSFIIQENLSVLNKFFVPIFFCVMGMLVDVQEILSWQILIFGMLYVVFAVFGKFIGCVIPALFLNFNLLGASRIGVGMIPRGEVALIIVGIGLSSGIISKDIFNIAIIMTFVTTLITPPILSRMFDINKKGVVKKVETKDEKEEIVYNMPNSETAELILNKVLELFDSEGFYIHRMEITDKIYQICKEDVFMTLIYSSDQIAFSCSKDDASFVHTIFYEVVAELEHIMKSLQSLTDKKSIGKKIFSATTKKEKQKTKLVDILTPMSVDINLKGNTKNEVIEELVDLLIKSRSIDASQKENVLKDLFEREETMSTGMQNGIAFPHAKTDEVDHIVAAVGIKKEGIQFDSLDLKPSNIFVITLSPKKLPKPYLQFMSDVTSFLMDGKNREKLLSCSKNIDLYNILVR